MKSLCVLIFFIKLISGTPTPIVLWHGMGDSCCTSFSLGAFKTFLEENIPGVYVKSLMFGNSMVQDVESGFFLSPNIQIATACKVLSEDPKLANGFNGIGFSQGSQFFRGLVQRCGDKLKVKTLVSLGGQHQGVYGLPHCFAIKQKTCDYIRELLNYAAYNSFLQKHLVQATYWHDPLAEQKYRQKSAFLSDINNELFVNNTYVKNLNKLERFVLVKFDEDSMVQPRESAWFGFYTPGQSVNMTTLQDSRLYLEDRLGLRKMDKEGRLIFLSSPTDHLRFSEEWFIQNILNPFLST